MQLQHWVLSEVAATPTSHSILCSKLGCISPRLEHIRFSQDTSGDTALLSQGQPPPKTSKADTKCFQTLFFLVFLLFLFSPPHCQMYNEIGTSCTGKLVWITVSLVRLSPSDTWTEFDGHKSACLKQRSAPDPLHFQHLEYCSMHPVQLIPPAVRT